MFNYNIYINAPWLLSKTDVRFVRFVRRVRFEARCCCANMLDAKWFRKKSCVFLYFVLRHGGGARSLGFALQRAFGGIGGKRLRICLKRIKINSGNSSLSACKILRIAVNSQQVLTPETYCTTRSRTWSVTGLLWAETEG